MTLSWGNSTIWRSRGMRVCFLALSLEYQAARLTLRWERIVALMMSCGQKIWPADGEVASANICPDWEMLAGGGCGFFLAAQSYSLWFSLLLRLCFRFTSLYYWYINKDGQRVFSNHCEKVRPKYSSLDDQINGESWPHIADLSHISWNKDLFKKWTVKWLSECDAAALSFWWRMTFQGDKNTIDRPSADSFTVANLLVCKCP